MAVSSDHDDVDEYDDDVQHQHQQRQPTDALLTDRARAFARSAPRRSPREVETDPIFRRFADNTRRISGLFSPTAKTRFRDGGGFRNLADGMVTRAAIPLGALACPSAGLDFLRLSRYGDDGEAAAPRRRSIRYGDHESQFVDVFLPPPPPSTTSTQTGPPSRRPRARGAVFFVHGGAWGSGRPWFYRLVTKPFLEAGLAVAIAGYRVYPDCGPLLKGDDRGGVRTQVDDLEAAFRAFRREHPAWCDKDHHDRHHADNEPTESGRGGRIPHHLPHVGTIVVGHSSGAHISMLWMIERAKRMRARRRRRRHHSSSRTTNDVVDHGEGDGDEGEGRVDALVGISGVYDVGDHFDYEASRGVEEISPLKPVNGFDRGGFDRCSPRRKVPRELLLLRDRDDEASSSTTGGEERIADLLPGRILLVHGAEDDVVPVSSTCEMAGVLKRCLGGGRSCGSSSSSSDDDDRDVTVDEFYVPGTGHQDAVADLFLLGGRRGPVSRTVTRWILESNRDDVVVERSRRQRRRRQRRPRPPRASNQRSRL